MQTNDSTAYDLSIFEPRQEARQQRPKLRLVKNRRPKAQPGVVFKTVCIAAVMVTMVAFIIYNKVMLTELGADINRANANLTQLQSTNVRLATELESRSSLRTLEEYASAQMGMAKLDQSQIIYMDMSEGDRIEIQGKDKDSEKFKETVTGIMEYLKLK